MHHLLATILLLLPGWGTQADIPLLQYSNLSIADLAQQFLLYVLRTYPTEGSQAWESEFNRVFGTQQPSPPGNRKKPEPAPVEAPKAEPVRIGTELNINRVATGEEVCLATKDYVQALGLLFQREKNTEFCFALFGHWGRGKTFLMDELAGVLKKAKYETVRFSVWQYPKAPEVWVSLYETFARAAYPNNPLISLPRIFRASVAKTGIWPVFAALAGLVLAAWWPREAQAPTASTHLSWLTLLVGSFSVAYVGGVLAIIQQTVARLRKNYLTATRHSENLGLQATIGEDLKALITGWMPGEEFPTSLGTTCSLIAVLGTATGVAWHLINGGTTRANDILFVVLVVIASLLVAWLFFPGKVPARVLLVVDDLDRCSFGQLLSVIESIKLLVEDPKVSARVQVAMLVEEDILGHAILEKYAGLLKPDPPRTVVQAFSESRVLRENREKLFSAYLRLPRLSKEEIEEVLSRFGRKSASQADSARQADSPVPPTGGAAGTASSISQAARSAESPVQPRVGGPTASPTKDIPTPAQGGSPQGAAHGSASAEANAGPRLEIRLESLALGETEKQYLIEAIRAVRAEAVSADDPVGEWGPRSVRSLCFRYQLARLLLKRPNEELEPSQLRELAFEMVNASVGKSRSDSQIGRVASLVA